jgi:hypothetical protein
MAGASAAGAVGAGGAAAATRCETNAGTVSSSSPPRVAFCIAGAARSFGSPLVLSALRFNLVTPLAGNDPVRGGSRLFLSLKTSDSAKSIAGVSFGQHRGQAAPLLAALSNHWLSPLIGEAVIVNGSGAYLGERGGGGLRGSTQRGGERVTQVNADPYAWRRFRATPCVTTDNATNSHRTTMTSSTTSSRCCRKSNYLLDPNNEERLVHQHLGLRWCSRAITRFEERRMGHRRAAGAATAAAGAFESATSVSRSFDVGPRPPMATTWRHLLAHEGWAHHENQSSPSSRLPHEPGYYASGTSSKSEVHLGGGSITGTSTVHLFDLVVFARPDLVWWRPILAWCDWPWSHRMLACDRPGCDMAWVTPRRYMERLLGQAELHRDCNDRRPPPHGASRSRNVREIAGCCSTSEWLLWYAQSTRAAPLLASTSRTRSPHEDPADSDGEIPVQRTSVLEPDRSHFTILRETSNACERSLSKAYSTKSYALRLQQRHGLSVATGAQLRRIFGENVSACRAALLEPSPPQISIDIGYTDQLHDI